MKKDNDMSTCTLGKEFSKRLELVKEKCLLMAGMIEDWDREFGLGKDRSQFILDCFKKGLMLFPTIPVKANNPEELREWPRLSSLKEADQPMTQEQMKGLWQSIEERIETYGIDEDQYIFIDFEKGTFVLDGTTVSFLDASIDIAPVSNHPLKGTYESFDLLGDKHLRGAAYLVDQWDEDMPTWGLLKTVDEDGKDLFIELRHFSMITRTLPRNADNESRVGNDQATATGEGTRSEAVSAPEECAGTINPDMFILFNKPQQAFWSARF